MKRFLLITVNVFTVLALIAVAGNALAAKSTDDRLRDLEKKVQKLQVSDAQDRINWSGELRVEAHAFTQEFPAYFDGMVTQYYMTGAMFYAGVNGGAFPTSTDDIDLAIAQNYSEYLYFAANLTFDQLKQAVQGMDPAMIDGMMQMIGPKAYRDPYESTNSSMYTTRLRLRMDAKVAKNVSFAGRLSMYKPWGAATQTNLFNGQANSLNTDVNWPGVPGDATVKVDAAYFTWKSMFSTPLYLSLGRRPSTGGPPMHYRQDELRQGTPMGTIIDMQFDGATLGYRFGEKTVARACYGLGYESRYGNASVLDPDYATKDAQFFGFNIDAYDTEEMQIQTTFARAFDLTDGFIGQVILPNNPVTGGSIGADVVMRYSPSANLGDMDIASVLLSRRDGAFDWFVTGSWNKSHPNDVTTPFGGMFSGPFETPESQTGSMYYLGARYNFSNEKTKLGLEWNKGSQYWFNFTPAQDDLLGAKTATRGTVWEGYLTHRITKKFIVKLAYIDYAYDYSGSGWHLGTPEDLDSTPLLGFATPSRSQKISLGFSARF